MIQLDLSILNQKGTPMFNSDIFANRPPFGIVGRIFISTDTSQIFRDTGTSYVLIASTGSSGTITGSGTTGTLPLWSGSTSLGNSTIIEGATKISTTKYFQADRFYLTDASLAAGVVYYNVGDNRLTFANYNSGGIIRFETNGGTNAGTIDAAQNLSISGTITGSSIIKSGGLSTQFLKADGSTSTLTNPITGTGTPGALSLFLTSSTLGDSLISQSGTELFAFAKTFVNNTNTGVSLINPLGLSVGTTNTFNGGISWPALEPCDNVEFIQANQYGGNINYGKGSYTANHLILSSFQFLVASTTITSTQATIGIRSLSNQILQARINGTNNGTITHFANSLVYGDFAASTARFNFTNRYGYLVNDLDEYGAGHTYTNRYAFYNQGANDHNYFAGKMLLNTLDVTSNQLSVVGTSYFNGALTGTSATFSSTITSGSITANSGGRILTFDNIRNYGTALSINAEASLDLRLQNNGVTSLLLISTGAATFSNTLYIGASSINASAQLEVYSTSKGFLPPRMTTTQKNAIASPLAGLMVYDTTLNKLCVRTAAAWETITSV